VVQGAAIGTLRLCAAACDLRGECLAFSHTTESTEGICKLHGALHEGLIAQFNALGEFTTDSHDNGTEQERPSHIREHLEYPTTLHGLVQPALDCSGPVSVEGDRETSTNVDSCVLCK
jgi:hypothetical protein